MSIYLAIAVGGSLGAVCRYWVSTSTYAWLGTEFPWGTLMVNVTGSFLMGLLTILLSEKLSVAEEIRFALIVGFLGSYTTFSTFALDVLHSASNEAMLKAGGYIVFSVVGSLAGVWAGFAGARHFLR
jgi:CrcB protein